MPKLNMFNQIKGLAFGLDGLFKADGQTNVKFHQVTAAVFLAVSEKMEARDLSALHDIFGDAINDPEELESMRVFIADVVAGIKAAASDRALNDVMNNYRYVDQPSRFPSYIMDEPNPSQFKGQLVINHSYQKKETLEPGDTVNVVLTIDRNDATQLVRVVQEQLEALGLVVGRLTSTTDTAERHVSFGLRMQYTEELGALIDRLNETVLPTLTLETSAKMQVVTPMDIRTSRSAISLLSEETVAILQSLQKQIDQATGDTGNQLPRLHITHGNSPIIAATKDSISQFMSATACLNTILKQYNLNLVAALLKKSINDGNYNDVFDALAGMVQKHPSSQLEKKSLANQIVQDLLPLPNLHLEKLVEVAYSHHCTLTQTGAAIHEKCKYNVRLFATFLQSNNVIESNRAFDEYQGLPNSPYDERDRIGDQLVSVAAVRFALEACLQKNQQILSEQNSSLSTVASQAPSVAAIPSIWASNTTNQTRSNHDAATFTFGGSK